MDRSHSSDAPAPRLAHLIKWPDFDGYGFNLHGEKTKPGQYIGKVDPDSPAEAAGLKARDRIIEVNGTNISNENHKQVVQRIKAVPDETKLLVVDERAEEYYKAKNIIVTGDMPSVIYIKTPPRPSTEETGSSSRQSDEDGGSHISDNGSIGSSPLPSKSNSVKGDSMRNGHSMEDEMSSCGASPTPPTATPSPTPLNMMSSSSSTKGSNNSLDLNMSAQEMRAKLAARKKFDPKKSQMDLRKKYDIIQTL